MACEQCEGRKHSKWNSERWKGKGKKGEGKRAGGCCGKQVQLFTKKWGHGYRKERRKRIRLQVRWQRRGTTGGILTGREKRKNKKRGNPQSICITGEGVERGRGRQGKGLPGR